MARNYKNYNKRWTHEQEEYLKLNWGKVQVNTIARKVQKNSQSIYAKANRLGLGKGYEYAGYVSLSQLANTLNIDLATMYSYADKFKMPYILKTINKKVVKSILIENFYAWAEGYTRLIDCTNIPRNHYGPEPDWLKDMRKNKHTVNATNEVVKQVEWTPLEESKLKVYAISGKFTLSQLAVKMGRTENSIQIKLSRLGMLHYLVIEELTTWSLEEEQLLLMYVVEFSRETRLCDWTKVARALGKTEGSCRKKYKYIQTRKDVPRRIRWDKEAKHRLDSLVRGYTFQNCEIDWTYIAEELDRSVDACKSQHRRLKAQ